MSLLDPQSIAVIGASAQAGKVGHDILKNLLTQGFEGAVFPINPKGGEILGKTVFASVKDTPATPDLAVIVIPAAAVAGALTECGEKGIKNVVVISAGFGEVHTDEGKKMEEELIKIAKKYSINLVGPNCLGIVRPGSKMNASFAKDMPPEGSIAIISQSGATAVALMDAAPSYGLGLSVMLSIGNKAVLDEADFLEICEKDDRTKVVGFYLESIKDGRRFLETARRVAKTKPIVLLKSGVSEHGRKAASSHTGALAGSDSAIDALCMQAGLKRAKTSEEFFDLLAALSTQPALPSNRIAIITNAGGPGILATDSAEKEGLQMPALSPSIAEKLKAALPPAASIANPIDVLGDGGTDRYEAAFQACQADPQIDGLVVILTPQVMTPAADIARMLIRVKNENGLMPIAVSFMGGASVIGAKDILRTGNIPCFDTPERAVHALAALRQNSNHQLPATRYPLPANADRASKASSLLAGKTGLLDEETTAQLFALYKLPMPRQVLVKSAEEAVRRASEVGYPLIAKISSPQILHKTDIGGVRANLKNDEEVALAYRDIVANAREHMPEATINGVLLQEFLPVGNEFIVGAVRDPSFGPLIMAGLGGIYTELFRDTSFRIAPVQEEDAYQMLTDLEAWKLLLGMRGKPQADIDALAELTQAVSELVTECPRIAEIDLNPVLVRENGVTVADAKVVIEKLN